MILRRFEIYSYTPGTPEPLRKAMALSMQDCARYIPEVLDSAIGAHLGEAPLDLAWEHAYASPAAYRRYMEHPFHAAILDRYLTHDSPEKIITSMGLGVDLIGYVCEARDYFLPEGARRITCLELRDGAAEAFAAIAEAASAQAGMAVSVLAENSLANRWTDGVTEISGPPVFSHIWEQGFASLDEARSFPTDWRAAAGDMVESSLEVLYEIMPGFNYGAGG
jgi:hypothetical protein